MKHCKKCGHEKTWNGDDINCPFQASDNFSADNWNCGIIGQIRRLCEKAMEGSDHRHQYQFCDEQHYVTINTSDIDVFRETDNFPLCLWVSWYKNRGRTEAMWLLNECSTPRTPTYQELEAIINYYK